MGLLIRDHLVTGSLVENNRHKLAGRFIMPFGVTHFWVGYTGCIKKNATHHHSSKNLLCFANERNGL